MLSPVDLGRSLAVSRPVSFVARSVLASPLRILAYHDVPELAVLERHLQHLTRHYQLISADDVLAARSGSLVLGPRSVWVTFDDAYPSALAAGPLLADFGVRATVFVCPGVIGTDTPFWWQTVDTALGTREAAQERIRLKRLPDRDRREAVRLMAERLDSEAANSVPQASSSELLKWVSLGHTLGNHTWDHPTLDTCSDEEQETQIVLAHDWLTALMGEEPRLFAYPNGNSTPKSAKLLQSLGYRCAALFDMRLSKQPLAMEVSRIRVDARDSVSRLRGAAAGSLGLAAHAVGRVSEVSTNSDRRRRRP